ncbi:MAG TPA: TIGR03617 family F420-dependent LLM class oxidoreductase [Anaerolineales bacterium]|nr:TIGR03617 family F420-dependent LLM class oxidoreductase [Anaerolineales bacterium]
MSMILDATLPPVGLNAIAEIGRAAEEMGFGGIWSTETVHDPFLPGALIAQHTRRIQFGTAVAIAFARSPAALAYTAWDLAQATHGRFILGLGTQVKAHIERRFGMPWPESVTGKLGEMLGAIRAFWRAWQFNEPLNYRTSAYKLNLMTPFFNPGPIEFPEVPIYIAGVNTGLARLAGESANGFLIHPFHSPEYLQQVMLPAIQEGLQRSSRTRADVKIAATVFCITNPGEREFVRQQIAFYASTPSYLNVMALHGWQEIAGQLSHLAAHKQWQAMPGLISNEMLATFAVESTSQELPDALTERYAGLVDRLSLYLPFVPGERDNFWRSLLKDQV